MDETVTLCVSLPRTAKKRLDAIARSLGRSTGEVAGALVASYVESEADAWQVEAVERADAGGPFYANDDVTAYLEARGRGVRGQSGRSRSREPEEGALTPAPLLLAEGEGADTGRPRLPSCPLSLAGGEGCFRKCSYPSSRTSPSASPGNAATSTSLTTSAAMNGSTPR